MIKMRLIDADELIHFYFDDEDGNETFGFVPDEFIEEAPAIEAEPIKHGRWLIGVGESGEPIGTYCSECGWSWERNIVAIQLNKVLSRIKTPRCPYCGAIMDEVAE